MLTALNYLSIFNLLFLLFGSLFIFLQNRRSKVNLSFALVVLATAAWVFANFMTDISFSNEWALGWSKLTLIGPIFIAYFFLLFSALFPQSRGWGKRIWYLLAVPMVSILLLVPTPWNVSSAEVVDGLVNITTGPLYLIFGIYFILYFAAATINLLRSFKSSKGLARTQIIYILSGFGLAVILALTTNLVLPILGVSQLAGLGPTSAFIFFLATAYAIMRHRLFDIRLAIRASIVKLLIISILSIVFYSTVYFFRQFFEPITNLSIALAAVGVSLFLSLFYEPLSAFVKKSTDFLFFQAEYSKAQLLRDLGLILSQSLNLGEIQEKVSQILTKMLKSRIVKFELGKISEPLVSHFTQSPKIEVYDELVREIGENEDSSINREILEELRKKEAAVIVPLSSKTGLIGLLVLGEKQGGDAYSSTDLEILESLMYQISTAVENASLFTQISEFNQKLRSEIDKATADLAEKNRNLTVLRRLDEIIINTLDLDEICQKIVDTIAWEAGFLGGLISLLNNKGDQLMAKAISQTPVLAKVVKMLPLPLNQFSLDLTKTPADNLLFKALKERQPQASQDFSLVFSPPLEEDLSQKLQVSSKIKNLVVYPLSSKGLSLGVVVFALHKPFLQLTQGELATLQAFMDEAGIAIENAKLYQDLKRINDELKTANEKLLELDKMKDELVSIASHELRTPMTAIKSYLWLVLNKYQANLNEKMKLYLDRAFTSSDRMINLVNDILSVSRLDTGRLELHLAATDLKSLIESVIEELQQRAKDLGLTLTLVATQGELPKALIDGDRIREVLMNLLGNAFKFTPSGGAVSIDLQKVKKNGNGEMLEITVSDTGKGIAKEDMPRLFQKFGRLSSDFVTAAETSGTGLGLYIAKGIVNLHGGEIWAKSILGKGASFHFTVKTVK